MPINTLKILTNSKYKIAEGVAKHLRPVKLLQADNGHDIVSFSKTVKNKTPYEAYVAERVRRVCLRITPQKALNEFINRDFIRNALKANYGEISKLLGKYGYSPKINMDHLKDSKNHFITTYNFAYNLTREKGFNLTEPDRDNLLEAALLHDIGKALVPSKVFNKPGKFTSKEREIMDLHSELSYLLLKNTGINPKTLFAIRNHHHAEATGDLVTEILSLCDEASALKENRVYKKGFNDLKAKAIIKEDSKIGKIDPKVVKKGLDIMSVG